MTKYYGDIPPKMLEGSILDIGAGTGEAQITSDNANHFIRASAEGRYQGIDKFQENISGLNIECADLFDYDGKYDTVICMHVVEHYPIENWDLLFTLLKGFVKRGGWLILGAPFFENERDYRHMELSDWRKHRVFRISAKTFHPFLGGVRCFESRNNYGSVRVTIRGLIWWLRCWVKGDRYFPFGLMRRSFIMFWEKGAE